MATKSGEALPGVVCVGDLCTTEETDTEFEAAAQVRHGK